MKNPRFILITGASSGIGEALACEYATSGIFLALSGRNQERLDAVAYYCSNQGAKVSTKVIDVTDKHGMEKWVKAIDKKNPLDLVIANAGIAGDSGVKSSDLDEELTRQIFNVNIFGVLNTIFPVIKSMRKRKRGKIALVSSIAGFRGLPSAPAYSASKALVKAYGEALHGVLKKDQVGVSIICPGFVKSRITEKNSFHMPLIISSQKAAQKIRKGLERDKILIAFPLPFVIFMWCLNLLTTRLADKLLNQLLSKNIKRT
ncbi:MAG: short-chain dehydrogenase [Magnetovibrio sp.]|nr:short-chain dehydrogenase [Magnetovibrio sp.]|tara:strand:+ start:201 stop:980 length:780 start_codon:yes stop_codon:yes gene_type:complete